MNITIIPTYFDPFFATGLLLFVVAGGLLLWRKITH